MVLAGFSMNFLKPFPSARAFLGVATIFLSGCLSSDLSLSVVSWRVAPDAIQTPYPDGVPHTDRQGRLHLEFDPDVSFFPVGLYHKLTGTYGSMTYSFEPMADAGFNTVVAWGDVPTDAVLEAVTRHGLQVIMSLPRDDEVVLARDHENVLGFDIDHEPSVARTPSQVFERLAAFEQRRSEIRALDRDRAVFTVDYPAVSPERIAGWETWRRAGDVTSFWAYPIAGDHSPSVGGPVGVGETVSLAVDAVGAGKPIWFVAQAFEGPVFDFDWRTQTPRQARATAYAAMVHGASGLIWFSFDSFVRRNGDVIGISPSPRPDYGVVLDHALTGEAPLRASARQMAESRDLWNAVVALNPEFTEQRELWLSPSADRNYQIEIRGGHTSGVPIRTQLKATRDGLYLVAVNVDEDRVDFRIGFDTPVESLILVAGDDAAAILDGRVAGTLSGFGSFVLKLTSMDR